jgi:asparagine N-glycosylation enzyme membrane subunit Stt3
MVNTDIKKIFYTSPSYYDEYTNTLRWLKNNSRPDAVVLAEWTEGHQVVALADRRVITSSKVYPSEAAEVASRYQDLSTFFFTSDENRAEDILYKYGASYVFLRKKFDYKSTCKTKLLCRGTNTMLAKMLGKKPLKYLEKIYESKNFLIYFVTPKI